ncbi:MAG: hypothetical protein A4E66_00342 [Syntrophus sp. PtaB.Bin001]|jgi:hypothetical protein|nr:MAG: hypothetical protein A4E66_00342 [Syntrophus sp. PtaB.Bin001]
MIDKDEIKWMQESIAGLLTVQSLLIQYLACNNSINKNEIRNVLDEMIDKCKQPNSPRGFYWVLKMIREDFDASVIFHSYSQNNHKKNLHPEWLRGVIGGGKNNNQEP